MAKKTVITPEATLSYPSLFQPRETPDGELKYGCALIFDKGVDLTELKAAALEAAEARWGAHTEAMFRARQLRWPFRDGAEKPSPRLRRRPGVPERQEQATAGDRLALRRA
jgi:hypothetical protein